MYIGHLSYWLLTIRISPEKQNGPKTTSNKTTFHPMCFTYIIFSAICKQLSVIHLPPTCLSSLTPCLRVFFFPLTICHCLVIVFPCCWQMHFSFGLYKCSVPLPSCHFRWWPGWCHVNDWRQWSPHTSCCSSCAPCWSWALFTTPPGSYIYTYGARRLVSDISGLIVTFTHLNIKLS